MPDTHVPVSVPEALTVLARLQARASVPVPHLSAPGPHAAAIEAAVAAALRAPDHGGLRPWRFVVIEGEARERFGGLLADSLARRDPAAPPDRLDLERGKPTRAPTFIVAGASIRHDRPGVPPWEQEAAASAGIMNFLHALDAQGFGAKWVSSPALGDPEIKQALGFEPGDTLLGWIYAGTPGPDRPRPETPDPAPHWRVWG